MRTIIIGGGAAGYAAAIAAAEKGDRVTVVERGRRTLKKLGVTGNGRGNLLNAGQPQYHGDEAFALEVLRHMPFEQIAAFLGRCGVALTEEDEGRMYPSSYLAASAVDALRLRAEKLGVEIRPDTYVTRIEKGFAVHAARTRYAPDTTLKSGRVKSGEKLGEEPVILRADRVIVTVGGAASPMHGTDGSSYRLLTDHGHRLTALHPALCAILTEKQPLEGLSGQRVRAKLVLDDRYESRGEALFADDGVSGIAAMQLSRFANAGGTLTLDLREAVMGKDMHRNVESWLAGRPGDTASEWLVGAASPALASALLRRAHIRPQTPVRQADVRALADVICHYSLKVTGTRGFEQAQVTAGGIDPADFDPATLQSRLVPGLYAAGEVLDVDGACGGFNLMFAFASGLLAGKE